MFSENFPLFFYILSGLEIRMSLNLETKYFYEKTGKFCETLLSRILNCSRFKRLNLRGMFLVRREAKSL